MAAKTRDITSVDHLLNLACARNVSVEFHHESADGVLATCRTRLLEVRGNRIITEALRVGDSNRIPVRRPMSVYMRLGGSGYQFDSAIEQIGLFVRLNDRLRVRAIAIRKPGVIKDKDIQRRAHYRISLAGGDPIIVLMVEAHQSVPFACSIDSKRILCRIVDISAGGLSLLADKHLHKLFRVGNSYYTSFQLPDVDESFNMLCEIRFSRVIEASKAIRMGMAFRPWPGTDLKAAQLLITKFVATRERRLLSRRK